MKKLELISILLCTLVSLAYAIEKDIDKFLESRPCYQKGASDTDSELAAYFKHPKYSQYFIDSTYFCERENSTVVVLVRENRIMGFRLLVPKLHYLSGQEADNVVKKIYETDGFKLVADGGVGINNKDFNSYIFIDIEAFKKVRQQAIDEFVSTLKP